MDMASLRSEEQALSLRERVHQDRKQRERRLKQVRCKISVIIDSLMLQQILDAAAPAECAGWWQVVGVCPEGQPGQPDHLFRLLPFETLSQPEKQRLNLGIDILDSRVPVPVRLRHPDRELAGHEIPERESRPVLRYRSRHWFLLDETRQQDRKRLLQFCRPKRRHFACKGHKRQGYKKGLRQGVPASVRPSEAPGALIP